MNLPLKKSFLILFTWTSTILTTVLYADPNIPDWSRGPNWPEKNALLLEALEASSLASYTVEIATPDLWDVEVTSGKIYRRVEDDGFVLRRIELYKKGKLDTIYICNRSGQYAVTPYVTVQLDETAILFALDYLYSGFHGYEAECGFLEIADANYRGIPCYRLTMKLPKDPFRTGMLIGRASEELDDPDNRIYHTRPFAREFLIGKDDHLIYSRKHFNAFGKVIYHQTLGEIKSLAKPDRTLFDTPEDINLVVPYRYDMVCMTPMASPELPPQPGIGDAVAGRWNRFLNWIGSPAVINGFAVAFLILALSLLAVAAVFKIRYRRQLKAQASRERRRR